MKWPMTKARVFPAFFLLATGLVALGQPVATQQTSASYPAGALLGATNSFSYSGTLWSLLWRPQLPAGWTIVSVSGTGNPELQSGEIVWTGTMPASPIQMAYTVQVPAHASGGQNLRGEVEYQLAGMVNPATFYASPDPLIVNEPLVPRFSGTPTNGVAPLTVAFTNLSANATGFVWDFGDGNTSSNIHPANTYSNAGSYSVTLTAIGPGVTNALTLTNYVVVTNYPPAIAGFTADVTNGLAPLTVAFTNLSANATGFVWGFGDGNSTTSANPANIYSNAGAYSVTLTAIGLGGTNVVVRTNYILVLNPARLGVTPAGLDFGLLTIGATAQASFVISNAGSATLTGAATVGLGPFTILSGTPFTLEESGTTNLTLNFKPVAAGVFSNQVVITSTGDNANYTLTGRAASAPRIVVLPTGGTDFSFVFDTVPGLAYVVQFKDSPDDLNWQTEQSVPGDGTRKTVTQSVSAPAQRFYRLWVQ